MDACLIYFYPPKSVGHSKSVKILNIRNSFTDLRNSLPDRIELSDDLNARIAGYSSEVQALTSLMEHLPEGAFIQTPYRNNAGDLLITLPDGKLILVEVKTIRQEEKFQIVPIDREYITPEILSANGLEGPQIGGILQTSEELKIDKLLIYYTRFSDEVDDLSQKPGLFE